MDTTDHPIELAEYWRIFWRRKLWFAVPFAVVVALSAAIAFLLPPVYRSQATILIERQTIPSAIVDTTVQGYVQEQIEQIRQRMTTWDNLNRIAQQFKLYPDEKDRGKVVREVESNIEVEMVDVQASSPDQPGQRVATIAFTLAFNAHDPKTAQAVTADLADWYMREHKAAREHQAADVEQFLEAESQKLAKEISELEAKLATFKQNQMNQLPELMDMNLRLYEKTEQDIATTEDQIRALQERIDAARAELSLTPAYKEVVDDEGNRMLTGEERLSSLTAEYLRATARYSAEHPDVIRLSREIRQLASQLGGGARADELMQQLVTLQEQLRQAREKYSDDHPEVMQLEKAVAAVERGFQTSLTRGQRSSSMPPPDNARYVALKTQIDSSVSDLNSEREKLKQLTAKLEDYEKRLFQTPVVERDFKTLSRDYDNARAKYGELKDKQIQARLAQQLESGTNAERFTLTSRPFLPTDPESPNRLGLMLLGGLLAFIVGLGSVTVVEYQDKTIRSPRTVADILGAPPLVVIPRMI